MREERGWLLPLLSLALVRGLIYIALVPPWQAPDETGHFEHAWLVARSVSAPTQVEPSPAFESELIASLYEWRYGEFVGRPLLEYMPTQMDGLPDYIFAQRSRTLGRFSLAYIWTAVFLRPFLHQDLVLQLYIARLTSVLLELGIVWLSWRIFKHLVPSHRLASAMTAFVVFLPQHTFINASVSEGPLAELCACATLYGWLQLFGGAVRLRYVMAVLGGTLLGLWTKNTAVFLLPLTILLSVLFLTTRQRERSLWVWTISASIALIFLGVIVIGQIPAWQWAYSIIAQWISTPELYLENGQPSLGQAIWQLFDSFWAQFGWMNVRAGPAWYVLVYVLTALAMEGWFLPRSRLISVPIYAVWILGIAILLDLGGWLIFAMISPVGLAYSQGRYLFPITVAVAFFLVGGWMRLMPERWQKYFPFGVTILLATMDAAAVFLTLWPYFYI